MRNKPGCNQRDAPDAIKVKEHERTEIYFRRREARPPSDYDVKVPHNKRKGWVVYFKYIVMMAAIIAVVSVIV